MSEYIPEGALLPEGINVDETAAYFGITDSSQILMEMETLNRHSALTIVLNKVSDLLLTDTFDLDSGSNRLKVETGEIYYILTGPLQLLDLTENLHDYLGLNPEVNNVRPDITVEQFTSLESLLDPLKILKIYAIGDVTGGNKELAKYVNAFDEMIKNPAENVENLNQINKEMNEILIDTKNMQMPRSISILSSAKVIATPKLIAPQKTIETKSETSENESSIIDEIPPEKVENKSGLIQPTALKPLISQVEVTEAIPLAKPERLQKAEHIPQKPLPPQIENTTMEELEKISLDTNEWVDEKHIQIEVPYSPPEIIKQQTNTTRIAPVAPKAKPIEVRIAPVAPKAKPIEARIAPVAPKAKPIEARIAPVAVAPKPVHPQNEFESKVSSLPKPKQRSPANPRFNSNTNGVIRTFPSGNICNGCGVSLSNSWRFCPLCGFNH